MNEDRTIIGYEMVPRVQQPLRKNSRIVYFHTADNPFGNYESMKVALKDANRETILMRAYGVATKSIAGRFPKFNQSIHVIPDAKVPSEGTNYHLVDPCAGRNWFMGWVRVDARGRKIIYREWPCPSKYIEGVGYPGEWAISSGRKADGEPGEAQQPFGFGLARYRREILGLEGWRPTGENYKGPDGEPLEKFEPQVDGKTEIIEARLMDARYGNTKILSRREESLTLIEEMENHDLEFLETTPCKNTIDEGIDLVNDLLDFDPNRPIDSTNEPRLYIAESCANIIYAMQEWTGKDGLKGATKDPIDIVRWVATHDLEYLPSGRAKASRVRSY